MMNHTVPEGVVESRLERYAFDVFDEILPTRKSVRKAIKRGEIRVDGKICDPGFWIKPGQDVELHRLQTSTPRPFRFPLRIVFEDQWLAVVEKPPGFAVNGNRYRTVENMLLYNLNTSNQKDALRWPKPVHRLDNSTGGLMIAAKTHLSLVRLGWQFQGREVRKRYRAIVIGRLEGSGSIQYPLDGRNAETIFTAVEHVPSLKNGWVTLIDLWSRTGRTHQLRRHLSNLGFPILGDKLYGVEGEILRSKGLFLWGVEISFKHPISGSELSFRIKEADKFDSFLRREKRRWGKYH
ncbi:MAG: RluA family pseudouridine synthase [Spirochaetota bacterium]|nr:RluA family pseudouridine synthase [Spirochaetota bacterium]